MHEGYCMRTLTGDYLLSNSTYPENYVGYVPVDVCSPSTTPNDETTATTPSASEGTSPTTVVPTTDHPTTESKAVVSVVPRFILAQLGVILFFVAYF